MLFAFPIIVTHLFIFVDTFFGDIDLDIVVSLHLSRTDFLFFPRKFLYNILIAFQVFSLSKESFIIEKLCGSSKICFAPFPLFEKHAGSIIFIIVRLGLCGLCLESETYFLSRLRFVIFTSTMDFRFNGFHTYIFMELLECKHKPFAHSTNVLFAPKNLRNGNTFLVINSRLVPTNNYVASRCGPDID